MVMAVKNPVRVAAEGGKSILEFAGRASGPLASVSVAHMIAPGGWNEPFQQPSFDEVTIVTRGTVRIEYQSGTIDVGPGQAAIVTGGERIRYSNPGIEEAEYWAVCAPAFSSLAAGHE